MKKFNLLLLLIIGLPLLTFSTIVVPLKVITYPDKANGYFSWEEEPVEYNIQSYIVKVYEKIEENNVKEIYKVKTKNNFTKIPSDYLGRLNVFFTLEGVTEDGSIIRIGDEDIPMCSYCQQWETQCFYICNGIDYGWVLNLNINPLNSMSRLILTSAFDYYDYSTGQNIQYFWYMSMDNYNNNFSPSLKSAHDLVDIPANSGSYYGNTGGLFTSGLLAGIPKDLGPWTVLDNQYAEITGGEENCGNVGITQAIGHFNSQAIADWNTTFNTSIPDLECTPAPGGPFGTGGGRPDSLTSYSHVLTHYWVECDNTIFNDLDIDDYLNDNQDFGVSLWNPCDTNLGSYDSPFENISSTYLQNINEDLNLVWSSNSDIYLGENGQIEDLPGTITPGLYKYYILFNDGSIAVFFQEIEEKHVSPITYSDFVDVTIFPVPLVLGDHFSVKVESEASLNINYAIYDLSGELLSSKMIKVKKGDERTYKNFKIRNEWFPYNLLVHKFTFDDGSEIIINTTVTSN